MSLKGGDKLNALWKELVIMNERAGAKMVRDLADRQRNESEGVWSDYFKDFSSLIPEPHRTTHNKTGRVATINMPITNSGEVVLYNIGSGLNTGRPGWPGGKVNYGDVIIGARQTPPENTPALIEDYVFGGPGEAVLGELGYADAGLGLRAVQIGGARELEEETRGEYSAGVKTLPDHLALAGFWSILYGKEKMLTQQVATLLVPVDEHDIDNLLRDRPGAEAHPIGLFTPENALDRLTDRKVPLGNWLMAKDALDLINLPFNKPVNPASGAITYPGGDMSKRPSCVDTYDFPSSKGVGLIIHGDTVCHILDIYVGP